MVRQFIPWNGNGGQLLDAFVREMEGLATRIQDDTGDELTAFSPRTNVAETDQQFEISIDLPGMAADDFAIEVHEGRLSVSGERSREASADGKTFHRVERHFGKFRRTFSLGQDIDTGNIAAEYQDGVLHVRVPKSAKAQPTKIQVRTKSDG